MENRIRANLILNMNEPFFLKSLNGPNGRHLHPLAKCTTLNNLVLLNSKCNLIVFVQVFTLKINLQVFNSIMILEVKFVAHSKLEQGV